jgi:hypothetical protein
MDILREFLPVKVANGSVPIGMATNLMPQISDLLDHVGILIGYPANDEKGRFYPETIQSFKDPVGMRFNNLRQITPVLGV